MLIRKPADLRYSDVTPKEVYLNRRKFIGAGVATLGALALPSVSLATTKINGLVQTGPYRNLGNEKPSPKATVTGYNNFYEFGTEMEDPSGVEYPHRRRGHAAQDPQPGPGHEAGSRGRTHLPSSLRGALVDCG